MNDDAIRLIQSYISEASNDLSKEHPKLDFKAKWYDLKSNKGVNEFLKDTTAMANTVGLHGYIIIGYNEKTKEFTNSSFKESGFSDTSYINDLVAKNVVWPFDFSIYDMDFWDHTWSIIHIPPSLSKPHVIKNYQTFHKDGEIKKEESHRIFVRKNSRAEVANKYDLEMMFYDRKNLEPEYQIEVNIGLKNSQVVARSEFVLNCEGVINIENMGKRSISPTEIEFYINLHSKPYVFKYLFKPFTIKPSDLFSPTQSFSFLSRYDGYPQDGNGIASEIGILIRETHEIPGKIKLANGKEFNITINIF